MRPATIARWIALLWAIAIALPSAASAQSVADFYRGKRINLYVSSTVGGGYDQYARRWPSTSSATSRAIRRSWCRTWSAPKASRRRTISTRSRRRTAPRSAALSRNIGLVQLYEAGNPAIQFDARKMHWIGSPQQEVGTGIFSTKKGLRTHRRSQDPRSHRLLDRRATRRPRSIRACSTRSTALKIKVIEGYPGSPEALIAFERGEVEAYVSGGTSAPTLARMVAQVDRRRRQGVRADGHEAQGALRRRPDRDRPRVDPEHKRMFEIVFTDQVMGRPFVVAPGVPADRVAALRAAFDATMKDATFLAEAKTAEDGDRPGLRRRDQRPAGARLHRPAGGDRAHPRAGEIDGSAALASLRMCRGARPCESGLARS